MSRTGGPKAFAAGAVIREMAELDPVDTLNDPRPCYRNRIDRFAKPPREGIAAFMEKRKPLFVGR